jgi:HD-GYP domain-containing protein (c-di-GMP phosphodiesterase class II)
MGMGRTDSAAQQTHDVLLAFLRERQPDLAAHLRDVGRLAAMTGRRLGLEGEDLEELRLAAELHDIGKAAIPDSILNKAGPLNDDEWKFMLRHTIVGERILATVPELRSVARLVRSSLERWDGTGYPDGLAGPDIPVGSRIVFVCDAFHAMTSVRPYYPARDPQEAIEELRRGAGTQFDPQVVEALVALWGEMGERILADEDPAPTSVAPPVLSGS